MKKKKKERERERERVKTYLTCVGGGGLETSGVDMPSLQIQTYISLINIYLNNITSILTPKFNLLPFKFKIFGV